MATYATYRHIELDHIGYGKKRVLKPPGGGTSDIFGPAEPVEQPRKVRQQTTSTIFLGGNDNPTPSKPKPGNDSFKKLFGEPEARPPSAVKNRMKSNIFLNDSASAKSSTTPRKISSPVLRNGTTPSQNGISQNGTYTPARRAVTPGGFPHTGLQRGWRIRAGNGNPVTGEGYTNDKPDGPASSPTPSQPAMNGTSAGTPGRQRVPPGGFSSGLW